MKDEFIIESMAESDNSRVTGQQLEYPYGKLFAFSSRYTALKFLM